MTDNSNEIRVIAIRPGILVGLHVSHEGGREYDVNKRTVAEQGASEITKIETTRTVFDKDEWEAGEKCRSSARSTVERICIRSDFGALCPLDREAELWTAVREARAMADAFNAGARYSRVRVRVLPARVASTDTEAAYSIAAEVRSLIDRMRSGFDRAALPGSTEDAVKQIRDAADRAKRLGAMLTDDNASKVNDAIEAARKVARDIVRRVSKGGEVAETVLRELTRETSAVEGARFAFLDLEEKLAPTGEALPAVELARFAEVEAPAADAAPVGEPAPAGEPERTAAQVPVADLEIPPADAPATPEPAPAPATPAREIDIPDPEPEPNPTPTPAAAGPAPATPAPQSTGAASWFDEMLA